MFKSFLLSTLILIGATFCSAQTSIPAISQPAFTVPAADASTICNTNGIFSVCTAFVTTLENQPIKWPTGLSFDGTTFSAPKISTAQLTITGGTTPANGLYIVSFNNGQVSYAPYTPPVTVPACTAINGVVIAATSSVPTGGTTLTTKVATSLATQTAHVSVTATFNSSGVSFPNTFEPFANIPYAGTINVYARYMPFGSNVAFAGGTVNLEVCP